MNIKDFIEKRWSPRAFANKTIDPNHLKEIFQAAGRAPSSFNEQPWRYLVGIKGTKSYDLILNSIGEWNQSWASTAPVLAIGVVKETFSRNGNTNHHASHDLGASSSFLTLKAFEHGIYVHQMAGFDADKAREAFTIPEGYSAITTLAIGYIGDKSDLPEDIASQENGPSERIDLEKFVFSENWESPNF